MRTQTKHHDRKYFFNYCLQHFTTEKILEEHKEVCLKINGMQAVKMPKNKYLTFYNYHKQLKAPFVIYADFECITVPIEEPVGKKEKEEKRTKTYQEHKACGCGYKVVCIYDDKYSKPMKTYRGPDAIYKLIEAVLGEEEDLHEIIQKEFNKKNDNIESRRGKLKKQQQKNVIYARKSIKRGNPCQRSLSCDWKLQRICT